MASYENYCLSPMPPPYAAPSFVPNPNMSSTIPNIAPYSVITEHLSMMKSAPPCPILPNPLTTQISLPKKIFETIRSTTFENFRTDGMVTTCCNCKHTNYTFQTLMVHLKNKLNDIDEVLNFLRKCYNIQLVPDQRSPSIFAVPNEYNILKSNLSVNANEFKPSQMGKNRPCSNPKQSAFMNNNTNNVNSNEETELRIQTESVDTADGSMLESGLDSGVDSTNTDSAIADSVASEPLAPNDDNDISGSNYSRCDSTECLKSDGKTKKKKPKAGKKVSGNKPKPEEGLETCNNANEVEAKNQNYRPDDNQSFKSITEPVNQKSDIRTSPQHNTSWRTTIEPPVNHFGDQHDGRKRIPANGSDTRRQNGPNKMRTEQRRAPQNVYSNRRGGPTSRDHSGSDRGYPPNKYNASYPEFNDSHYPAYNSSKPHHYKNSYVNSSSNTSSKPYTRIDVESVVREEDGDLMTVSEEYSLAHCVAEDLRMGKGIAVLFRQRFNRIGELLEQKKTVGEVAVLLHEQRYVFYLITKKLSNQKPTKDSVHKALMSLRRECERLNVKKVAMPRLACGLDLLNWEDVSGMIYEVFVDSDIEIRVCNVKEEETNIKKVKEVLVKRETYPLVDIETERTAFVIYGTVDGHMDKTAENVNSRYSFKKEYQENCAKYKPGDVIAIHTRSGRGVAAVDVFVLIIRKTISESFSFRNLEICLEQLGLLVKKKLDYIGIEVVEDDREFEDLNLFNEKLQSAFRHKLHSSLELYICGVKPNPSFDKFNKFSSSKSNSNGSY